MALSPSSEIPVPLVPPNARANEILDSLISIAGTTANAQIGGFATRLANALIQISDSTADGKTASLTFNIAGLLKKNTYAFYYLASIGLEKALRNAVQVLHNPAKAQGQECGTAMSLVSYEDVDQSLLLDKISRPIEVANADGFAALDIRIAHLLDRDDLRTAQNPFRPDVFVEAFYRAWCEFNPDPEAHSLLLPLLRPDIFIDLMPIIQAINAELIACGIMPDLTESFRIRKTNSTQNVSKKTDIEDADIARKLRQLFAPAGQGNATAPMPHDATFSASDFQAHVLEAAVASNKLLGYLADVQKNGFDNSSIASASANRSMPHAILRDIKAQAPQGALNKVDENTIDLLTKVFDVVFRDQNIPQEIRALIGFLQVPVLKAALVDKEFFFKQEHPARRVIDLLSKTGVEWNPSQGEADPIYQSIKRNVERIQQDLKPQPTVFAEVIADLESFISHEENQAAEVLAAPITHALRQEKIGQATKVARIDVAARIGTGEVIAFVETFLEKKWVSVLTIAYTVADEKPQALASAVKTMDDLIWSVKPKITVAERKEMIARLPSMLAALNKWLNVVKWDDADRLRFFADLAECHASIVRAPLEMSPQRQLEIAIEVAKAAAERRLQKRAVEQPEPPTDEFTERVNRLERGMWLEFDHAEGETKKVKLAWVSPLRSLYIFATRERKETFSLTSEELAKAMREQRVQQLVIDGMVDRALVEALSANDSDGSAVVAQSAA